MLEQGFHALMTLALVQGVRLIAGWRLTTTPTIDSNPTGQFRVVDLLEWTTTIALCLGSVVWLNLLLRELGNHSLILLDLVGPNAQLALLGAPIVLALLAVRRPASWKVATLVMWSMMVVVGLFLLDLRHPRMTIRILLALASRSLAPHLTAYLTVIVVNALALRAIGFRWRSGSKSGP
jgi:hypothetical protein